MSEKPKTKFSRFVWIAATVASTVATWRMAGWERTPGLLRVEDLAYLRTAATEREIAIRPYASGLSRPPGLVPMWEDDGMFFYTMSDALDELTNSLPRLSLRSSFWETGVQQVIGENQWEIPGSKSIISNAVPVAAALAGGRLCWASPAWVEGLEFEISSATPSPLPGVLIEYPEPRTGQITTLTWTNILAAASNTYPRMTFALQKYHDPEYRQAVAKGVHSITQGEYQGYHHDPLTPDGDPGDIGPTDEGHDEFTAFSGAISQYSYLVRNIPTYGEPPLDPTVFTHEKETTVFYLKDLYAAPAYSPALYDQESDFFLVKNAWLVCASSYSLGEGDASPSTIVSRVGGPPFSTTQNRRAVFLVPLSPTSSADPGYPYWKATNPFTVTDSSYLDTGVEYVPEVPPWQYDGLGWSHHPDFQFSWSYSAWVEVVGILTEFDFEAYTLDPPPDDTPYFVP